MPVVATVSGGAPQLHAVVVVIVITVVAVRRSFAQAGIALQVVVVDVVVDVVVVVTSHASRGDFQSAHVRAEHVVAESETKCVSSVVVFVVIIVISVSNVEVDLHEFRFDFADLL